VAPPREDNWIASHEILGVRSETSKLVFYPTWKGGAFWEFFALSNDPREMNNLYDDPLQGKNVAEMKRHLRALVDQDQDAEAAKMLDDFKESGK
jgi:arylsulfatase A-like enzyme